jgi:hypothetical protein
MGQGQKARDSSEAQGERPNLGLVTAKAILTASGQLVAMALMSIICIAVGQPTATRLKTNTFPGTRALHTLSQNPLSH